VGFLNVNRNFKKVLNAGMAGLGALQLALIVTGNLFSVFPLTGFGSFVISAPNIQGTNFKQVLSISAIDLFRSEPAEIITLDSVNIAHGFELTKRIDLTATPFGARFSSFDLNFLAPSVQGTKLMMYSTGLQSRTASFKKFEAHETYSILQYLIRYGFIRKKLYSPITPLNPQRQFELSAVNLELNDAKIDTNALKSTTLRLGGLKLQVVANPVTETDRTGRIEIATPDDR
jgi:hypothetical protein